MSLEEVNVYLCCLVWSHFSVSVVFVSLGTKVRDTAPVLAAAHEHPNHPCSLPKYISLLPPKIHLPALAAAPSAAGAHCRKLCRSGVAVERGVKLFDL